MKCSKIFHTKQFNCDNTFFKRLVRVMQRVQPRSHTLILRNGVDLKFIASLGDLHSFPLAWKDLVPKVLLYMRNIGSVSRAALHKQARQL